MELQKQGLKSPWERKKLQYVLDNLLIFLSTSYWPFAPLKKGVLKDVGRNFLQFY